MKLLLDECLPHRLRSHLAGHDVFTVAYMGWNGVKNGNLLAVAAAAGFDALVTTDKNLEYQQNTSSLPLAVVVLDAAGVLLADLLPLVPELLAALANMKPGAVTHVTKEA